MGEEVEKIGGRFVRFAGSPSRYIKLNVGGALYQTTISTLTKHDSMLRTMFSGQMEISHLSVSVDIYQTSYTTMRTKIGEANALLN
ncbi:unnamed protein product [Thelazia callipaeda]|uniref:BTB_2 domain-containing protein n=1 Tax=Thelazia callipaeda TaxID=103827 RepID=A0A0N5CQI3_THECL|nr:unnamed protein product [Thelazia callipaeda]